MCFLRWYTKQGDTLSLPCAQWKCRLNTSRKRCQKSLNWQTADKITAWCVFQLLRKCSKLDIKSIRQEHSACGLGWDYRTEKSCGVGIWQTQAVWSPPFQPSHYCSFKHFPQIFFCYKDSNSRDYKDLTTKGQNTYFPACYKKSVLITGSKNGYYITVSVCCSLKNASSFPRARVSLSLPKDPSSIPKTQMR